MLRWILLALALWVSPGAVLANLDGRMAAFQAEIDQLQSDLNIPGLAFAIVDDGEVLIRRGKGRQLDDEPFGTDVPQRIASVTKNLTAVLIQQLLLDTPLQLNDPVKRWLPDFEGPESVLIRHLLTHTSEGQVGEEYVYGSQRFALLGPIVTAVTGKPFDALLAERILRPAGMREHASPELGAHAGLVSTVDDLARYAAALQRLELIGVGQMEGLVNPQRSSRQGMLPTSLGWFAQEIHGHRVGWSFGQDDPGHGSALFLHLVDDNRTLVMLANSEALSNPFRLLMGDLRKSPFSLAFIRLFAGDLDAEMVPRVDWAAASLIDELDQAESLSGYRFDQELVGRVLIAIWRRSRDLAMRMLQLADQRYGIGQEPDPVVHFALAMVSQPPFNDWGVQMGLRLLADHPNNRWILLAQAELRASRAQRSRSNALYTRIVQLPNQHPDQLRRMFLAWSWGGMANNWAEHDPRRAVEYLEKLLELEVGGQTESDARARIGELQERIERYEREQAEIENDQGDDPERAITPDGQG